MYTYLQMHAYLWMYICIYIYIYIYIYVYIYIMKTYVEGQGGEFNEEILSCRVLPCVHACVRACVHTIWLPSVCFASSDRVRICVFPVAP